MKINKKRPELAYLKNLKKKTSKFIQKKTKKFFGAGGGALLEKH